MKDAYDKFECSVEAANIEIKNTIYVLKDVE